MTEPKTHTLAVPGAVLHYDVRSNDSSTQPVLLLIGLPTEDDGSRNDPLVGQNIVSCNHYQHDFDALRAASSRVVVAVGAESSRMVAGRAAVAVAERLETTPVTFPGGHDGFLGGEYGMTGDPDAFAATLRKILTN